MNAPAAIQPPPRRPRSRPTATVRAIERTRRVARLHLFTYLVGNALFWLLWGAISVTADRWYWWATVPATGWTLLLAFHLWYVRSSSGARRTIDHPDLVLHGAAVAAAAGLGTMGGLQVYWGLGGTWALREASGGSMDELGLLMSIASIALAFGLFAAAAIVLARAGFFAGRVPARVAHRGAWVVAVGLALGGAVNVLGPTNWERYFFGPIALVLALLCVIVARSHRHSPTRRRPAFPTTPAHV